MDDILSDFLDAYENSTISDMPINDAIWYMEAGLNYRFRHVGFTYDSTVVDSYTHNFTLEESGEVSGDDIEALLEEYIPFVDELSTEPFIASDFYVASIDESTITIGVSIIKAKGPFYGTNFATGFPHDLKGGKLVGMPEKCDGTGGVGDLYAYERVAQRAINYYAYANGLTNQTKYLYFSTVLGWGPSSNRGNVSNSPLYGNSSAPYVGHQTWKDAEDCIYISELTTYRNNIKTQVTNLGGSGFAPILLDINWIINPIDGSKGKWRYGNVSIGAYKQSLSSPSY